MSLSLDVYLCRVEEIDRHLGSKNELLFETILGKFEADDEYLTELKLEQGLRDILFEDPSSLLTDQQHFVALNEIIKETVPVLYANFDYASDHVSKAQALFNYRKITKDGGLKAFGLNYPPLRLPNSQMEYPGIGWISYETACATLAQMRPMSVLGINPDTARRMVMHYGWLERAEKDKKDLVGVYQ